MDIILIFVGFNFVLIYIWVYYLRERLPRDIPYSSNIITIVILIIICCTYIYIIKNLIKLSKISFLQKLPPVILHWGAKAYIIIYKPILSLDIFIKKAFTHNIQIGFAKFFVKIFDKFYTYLDKLFFVMVILLFPRLILIILLSFDIFCFSRINIFYNFT